MSANFIPSDIQIEIIKKFPVKALIQFRTVSKTWKSLIDSSEFIAGYQTHPHHLLIRYQHLKDFDQKYVSITDNDTFPQLKFPHNVPMSVELINDPTIVGSSRGLFCFYGYYRTRDSGMYMAVVWNPSIRKSVSVVVPNVFHGLYENVLGFGVCPNASDPMIVKIVYIHIWNGIEHMSCIPFQVEIFTLSSGVWRSLCSNIPRQSVRFTWSQVVIDRFIYWFAFDRITNTDGGLRSYNLIISFDMTSEEFSEIYLPERLALHVDVDYPISKLRESLVVIEYNIEAENPVYAVWMMMENGVEKLFTKLYNINTPDASVKSVLGFRKNGGIIMETPVKYYKAALEVYEPCSGYINDLGISGEVGSFFVSSYTETLLLLDHSDCSMYPTIS